MESSAVSIQHQSSMPDRNLACLFHPPSPCPTWDLFVLCDPEAEDYGAGYVIGVSDKIPQSDLGDHCHLCRIVIAMSISLSTRQ